MGIKEVNECVQEVADEAKKIASPATVDLLAAVGGLQEEMGCLSSEHTQEAAHQTTNRDARKLLAQAILDFAKWQETGYSNGTNPDAFEHISKQLWWEVSKHVRDITGEESPYPGTRGQRDAA